MLAVIGLGNPGDEYRGTRHNVGSRVVDALSWGKAEFEDRGPYLFRGSRIAGKRVLLVKPQTYMNRSGHAIARLFDDFPLDTGGLLVLSDDINLSVGRLRLRKSGGDGGQKGLGSIIEALGSEDFNRLRLGIGAPSEDESWADYVLRPFEADERDNVEEMIARAVDCVRAWVSGGPDRAMERFNR